MQITIIEVNPLDLVHAKWLANNTWGMASPIIGFN